MLAARSLHLLHTLQRNIPFRSLHFVASLHFIPRLAIHRSSNKLQHHTFDFSPELLLSKKLSASKTNLPSRQSIIGKLPETTLLLPCSTPTTHSQNKTAPEFCEHWFGFIFIGVNTSSFFEIPPHSFHTPGEFLILSDKLTSVYCAAFITFAYSSSPLLPPGTLIPAPQNPAPSTPVSGSSMLLEPNTWAPHV